MWNKRGDFFYNFQNYASEGGESNLQLGASHHGMLPTKLWTRLLRTQQQLQELNTVRHFVVTPGLTEVHSQESRIVESIIDFSVTMTYYTILKVIIELHYAEYYMIG